MASRHLDTLVRDFISGSSNPYTKFDPFKDLQDPTFMSFKIDFFPDGGLSLPTDAYSSGGLFRGSSESTENIMSYAFGDSAASYLAKIGAPTRQAALQKFKDLLYKIQEEAPWYFQQVSGLAELYKIDKAINYRGKDKVLVIDCLESIDLRMSLLGDLYRLVAFDFQNWREVLPANLRTFNMEIHVLEMRNFNTTYGLIADALANPPRAFTGEDRQKEMEKAQRKNVFGGPGSTLFSGLTTGLGNITSSVNNALGGLFTNLGDNAGNDSSSTFASTFEAVSVQTFKLKDCEFDFFTEAPSYLDTVSVKDSPEATFKFKINVGKIEKVGYYSFYDYVLSEWTKNVRTPSSIVLEEGNYSLPYFEPYNKKPIEGDSPGVYQNYKESIFPTWRTQSKASAEAEDASDKLRKRPLENALSGLMRAVTPYATNAINDALGKLTGGILGTAPLGNVYGQKSFIQRATTALNDFLTPGNQSSDNNSYSPQKELLNKGILNGASVPPQNLPKDILKGPAAYPQPMSKDTLSGAAANLQKLTKDILNGADKVQQNLAKDTLTGAPANGAIGDENVYSGNPAPGAPKPPTENVFK